MMMALNPFTQFTKVKSPNLLKYKDRNEKKKKKKGGKQKGRGRKERKVREMLLSVKKLLYCTRTPPSPSLWPYGPRPY